MNRDTLEKTFANAGERFIYRSAFRREQSLWQEQDPPIRLVPNSQFGVGVFSYFMLAELIEITTRPLDERDNPEPVGYHVRIASSGSLFQIVESRDPAPGTVVRLYLTGDDDVSVRRTLRDLLRVAEYDVEVDEEDLPTERWSAEELYYPEPGARCRKAGDDFWWVDGEGCLVADGIATSEERYGFMVNLRGRRQPQFTVDRKKLRAWDKDWVNSKIQDGMPELLKWPGLTLSWLWEVADATPGVANDIFQRLRLDSRALVVEGAIGHGVSADICRVGCFPYDKKIVRRGLFFLSDDWITQWRLGVWQIYVELPSWFRVAAPGDISGLPLVDPFDAELLAVVDQKQRYGERQGEPRREQLLEISASEETTPRERLHRLRRYAIVGLNLRAAWETPHVDRVLEEDEVPLLPALAAWAPPGSAPRKVIGPCLASVSQDMHLPLNTVIKRASRLAPAGWVPPAELPDELGNSTVTGTDARLLSYHCPNPVDMSEPISIGPERIVEIMATFDLSITKALQQIDRFSPFGYLVEARDDYPEDLTKVEIEALRGKPQAGLAVTAMELVALAGACNLTVQEAHAGLARLSAAGLITTPDACPPFIDTPTPIEVQAARDLEAFGPRLIGRRWSHPSQALVRLVRYLPYAEDDEFRDEVQQRRRLLDTVAHERRLSVVEVAYIAFGIRTSTISGAVDYLHEIFPNHEDLFADLPDDIMGSSVQCSSWRDQSILFGTSFHRDLTSRELQWQVWPADLAEAAIESDRSVPAVLDRLARYRELGAPIPVLDDEQRRAFVNQPVTQHDVEMLRGEDAEGYEAPVTEIHPLYLVQVAGRFGWTVLAADLRVRRYVPLGVNIHYNADACPDLLVHWQDLLVVTVHLDGQAPTLRGCVSDSHVAAAAELLGETPEQVRERLRPYAALIGFTLGEEPLDA